MPRFTCTQTTVKSIFVTCLKFSLCVGDKYWSSCNLASWITLFKTLKKSYVEWLFCQKNEVGFSCWWGSDPPVENSIFITEIWENYQWMCNKYSQKNAVWDFAFDNVLRWNRSCYNARCICIKPVFMCSNYRSHKMRR